MHGFSWTQEMFGAEIDNPEIIRNYHVYEYHHLDYGDFIIDAYEVFAAVSNKSQIIAQVKNCFLSAGWEGDGEIGLIWFPPFAGVGPEDTWGACVWHVKQSNNGTSWLACRHPLSFQRLLAQN